MQSLHYNSGSIKLKRERSTMVSHWEVNEVARWIEGLAGIEPNTSDIFLKNKVDGIGLTLLLREDLSRMGITQLDQQLILMQSIDLLLTLISRLTSETLALLFMHIHCAATTCYNLLKRPDAKDFTNNNSNIMNSPEFYISISKLSNTIVVTCHWLGRLPFIESNEYIQVRGEIIKILIQIRVLIRNLRLNDQINMPKTKLITEIEKLRTKTRTLVRQTKDSLFSSDCYLTRVHLQRPSGNDVNIEYTTMPDFTHVISSIETESVKCMGLGYSAINIGDEIIEINNQVVIGWDPKHFDELLRSSAQTNEICLLVKKMPRHNDDEIYTKRFIDGPSNPRQIVTRHALEQKKKQTQEYRTMLLEQEGEIVIESDDEVLYQTKHAVQIKRDQHSSLPDLIESIPNDDNKSNDNENSNHIEPSSSTSSVSTNLLTSPPSPTRSENIIQKIERPQSAGSNQSTPNSQRKVKRESYFSTLLRPRQDPKSVIADMDDHTNSKDHPQLVNIKRIQSICQQNSSNNSTVLLHDDQISSSPPATQIEPMSKSSSQTNLQTTVSALSSLTNIFKFSDSTEKNRSTKRTSGEVGKVMTLKNESKMDICSTSNSNSSDNINNNNNSSDIVTNKPPLKHNESRKSCDSVERRRLKRTPSCKNISCKDLGKGDCEGFLHRYLAKGTLSFVQWKLYWCVLKGGTLYIYKSKDDKNQEIEIKLEGKNVSPAPERKKFAFRITDDNSKDHECFSCSTRDEMAKWMNKMGLAAINFNIDDSRIAGFNKGFVHSCEGSPVTTPIIGPHTLSNTQHKRVKQISSPGDSENDSDKESIASWQKSKSYNSSISDLESVKDKSLLDNNKQGDISSTSRHTRSSSSVSLVSLPETNGHPMTTPLSRYLSPFTKMSSNKGHHRTCSSPIKLSSTHEKRHQENPFVHAAPRLSDSDSPNERSHQRTFINSKLLNENQQYEPPRRIVHNYSPLALNSSGGFPTQTSILSSASSDMTTPFSSPPLTSSSQRPSNASVFLADEELSSSSSRSASFCLDRLNSMSEDPNSPVFQTESSSPPINFSSSPSTVTSFQQYPPVIVRAAPVYISIYSSTPPLPIVKGTMSSSVPPTHNDQSTLVRRSPSPTPSQINESLTNVYKIGNISSDVSIQQQQQSSSIYKYHRHLPISTEKQEQK